METNKQFGLPLRETTDEEKAMLIQPLFTLTAEEVEDYKTFLEHSVKWNCGATNIDEITLNAKRNETLTRINQWQDENNRA